MLETASPCLGILERVRTTNKYRGRGWSCSEKYWNGPLELSLLYSKLYKLGLASECWA